MEMATLTQDADHVHHLPHGDQQDDARGVLHEERLKLMLLFIFGLDWIGDFDRHRIGESKDLLTKIT